jgi:hypothetical protein
MAKVKLGKKEFDVDSEEIWADGLKVSAADVSFFSARVKKGEFRRVKKLYLVMFFGRLCFCCIFFACCKLLCVRSDICCAEPQFNLRRGRILDCRGRDRNQHCSGAAPCEITLSVFSSAEFFLFFFVARDG